MKTLERIERYEDSIVAMYLVWPNLVLSIPFEIKIFNKWRKVVKTVIDQINAGLTPDIITVTDAYPDDKDMLFNLGVLVRDCPSSANYESYLRGLAEMVNDVDIYRDMQKSIRLISEGTPVKEVFGNIVTSALTRLNANGVDKFDFTMPEAVKLMMDDLEDRYESRGKPDYKLKTGIAKLDNIVGHFQPSDLIVVGARPSVGKTAFAVSLALNMGKAGKRVGFISTEMSAEQITKLFTAQTSQINSRKIRESDIDAHEWPLVTEAGGEISKLNIVINEKTDMKISEVIMRCRAWDMTERLDVVIIDYLTRLKPDKELGNKNLEVGEIAAQLKNIARALKIPVIALAQLNRGSANRSDKTPNMADLRDSGIIEQEADCILLLHREEGEIPEDNKNLIIVDKNRHGEAGMALSVNFIPSLSKWY